jgi:uncharacterized protein (DUF169 family)
MNWRTWSDSLKHVLRLTREPVAVAFTGAGAGDEPSAHGKVSVCQALKRASEGELITVTVETCGCPGGLVNLGLGQVPASGKERLVRFLIDKEKVYSSRVALYRSQQSVSPPAGAASRVLFTPLAQAEVRPDLVVFIGTPGSLHELLGLASYWEGGSMKAELAGPACRTGIAYPVVTGELGLSLLDFGARRLARFEDHELLVAVPFHRMLGVMAALESGVGSGREAGVEAAEREIDELGRVEAV